MMKYRPNVAAILRRKDGQILVGERRGYPGSWQFPQGGVNEGEDPLAAMQRELEEEIGADPARYEVVSSRGGYRYKFPGSHRRKGDWDGQEQTYFLCRYDGEGGEDEFELGGEHEEFSHVKWIAPGEFRLAWLPEFKWEVYERVFWDFFGVRLG